jgi:hypothetical protein
MVVTSGASLVSLSTAITQRLLNNATGRAGNPIRSRKGDKAIDLARRHTKFSASVSSNERDIPR